MVEYSTTSHNNIHVTKEYTKNIPQHYMEYALRFLSCSHEQVHLFMFAHPLALLAKSTTND
jgi:hypothetical protein